MRGDLPHCLYQNRFQMDGSKAYKDFQIKQEAFFFFGFLKAILLECNLNIINFMIFTRLRASVIFSKVNELYSLHHSPVLEHFHHPTDVPCTCLPISTPSPRQPTSDFLSL